MQNNKINTNQANWFSVPLFAQHNNSWLKLGTLRKQLLFRKQNGLEASGAIMRVGRKLLIDGDRYLEWVRDTAKINFKS